MSFESHQAFGEGYSLAGMDYPVGRCPEACVQLEALQMRQFTDLWTLVFGEPVPTCFNNQAFYLSSDSILYKAVVLVVANYYYYFICSFTMQPTTAVSL